MHVPRTYKSLLTLCFVVVASETVSSGGPSAKLPRNSTRGRNLPSPEGPDDDNIVPRLDNRVVLHRDLQFLQQTRPKCSRNVRIANGRRRLLEGGSIIRFRCEHGFFLFGSPTAACVRGQWSEPAPQCIRWGCGRLSISSGTIGRPLFGGAAIYFECQPGFRMGSGSTTLVCDGHRWNGTAPVCQSIPSTTTTTTTPIPTTSELSTSSLAPGSEHEENWFEWVERRASASDDLITFPVNEPIKTTPKDDLDVIISNLDAEDTDKKDTEPETRVAMVTSHFVPDSTQNGGSNEATTADVSLYHTRIEPPHSFTPATMTTKLSAISAPAETETTTIASTAAVSTPTTTTLTAAVTTTTTTTTTTTISTETSTTPKVETTINFVYASELPSLARNRLTSNQTRIKPTPRSPISGTNRLNNRAPQGWDPYRNINGGWQISDRTRFQNLTQRLFVNRSRFRNSSTYDFNAETGVRPVPRGNATWVWSTFIQNGTTSPRSTTQGTLPMNGINPLVTTQRSNGRNAGNIPSQIHCLRRLSSHSAQQVRDCLDSFANQSRYPTQRPFRERIFPWVVSNLTTNSSTPTAQTSTTTTTVITTWTRKATIIVTRPKLPAADSTTEISNEIPRGIDHFSTAAPQPPTHFMTSENESSLEEENNIAAQDRLPKRSTTYWVTRIKQQEKQEFIAPFKLDTNVPGVESKTSSNGTVTTTLTVLALIAISIVVAALVYKLWRRNIGIARPSRYDSDQRNLSCSLDLDEEFVYFSNRR